MTHQRGGKKAHGMAAAVNGSLEFEMKFDKVLCGRVTSFEMTLEMSLTLPFERT